MKVTKEKLKEFAKTKLGMFVIAVFVIVVVTAAAG